MQRGSLHFVITIAFATLVFGSSATDAKAQCLGDCSGDGKITTAEIETGVQIALLKLAASNCNYGSSVEIEDLVGAVKLLLAGGCPATPVPTATVTPTSTSTPLPTVTFTPGGVANAVAGGAAIVTKAMLGIPSFVTAVVTGLDNGGSSSADLSNGGAAGSCPQGGTATKTCTAMSGGGAELDLALNSCAIDSPDGTLTFSTSVLQPIMLISSTPASCPAGVSPIVPIDAVADVSSAYVDAEQNPTLCTRATLTSVVDLTAPSLSCFVAGAQLTLTGTLSSAIPVGSCSATSGGVVLSFGEHSAPFSPTQVTLSITSFDPNCVPTDYTLTFQGPGEVFDTTMNETAGITFNNFVVHVTATSTPTTVTMNGGLNFDCIQGAITLTTTTPLNAVVGDLCPTGGEVTVTSSEGTALIAYQSDGSVKVDVNDDGTFDNNFSSCTDPILQLCPQSP